MVLSSLWSTWSTAIYYDVLLYGFKDRNIEDCGCDLDCDMLEAEGAGLKRGKSFHDVGLPAAKPHNGQCVQLASSMKLWRFMIREPVHTKVS